MSQRPTDVIVSRSETLNAFMRGVYLWMGIGLAVTAVLSYLTVNVDALYFFVFSSKYVFYGLLIAEIGLVFVISGAIQRLSGTAATGLFLLYSALNGLTLASILLIYTDESIFQAFFTAAGMFGAMSVFGMVTKRDLTGLGGFMFMGLVGILIASVINFFLQSNTMSFAISIIGVFVFLGLTAYDTQYLCNMGETMPEDDDVAVRRGVILGALKLYLDFINLFLMLLRLIGDRR